MKKASGKFVEGFCVHGDSVRYKLDYNVVSDRESLALRVESVSCLETCNSGFKALRCDATSFAVSTIRLFLTVH